MTNKEKIIEYINQGPDCRIDLINRFFFGKRLDGVDLNLPNLKNSNLCCNELIGPDLRHTNFEKAILKTTNLGEVILKGLNLLEPIYEKHSISV